MNCNECVKIHPLPECIESDAYSDYFLTGLVFSLTDTDMIAHVRNVATNQKWYFPFTTESDGTAQIDIADMFPLMNHVYEIKFVTDPEQNPAEFTITNTDETTETGCCVEFRVHIGLTDPNDTFIVSSQSCPVA